MPEVVFETDRQLAARTPLARPDSLFVRLLKSTGMVKTKRGAEFLLLMIAALCFMGIFLVLGTRDGNDASYGNYETFIQNHPEFAE